MSIGKKGELNLNLLKSDIAKMKVVLPKQVGNLAKNHFLEGFRKGGYQTDDSSQGWTPRKPARTPRAAQRDAGRALLVDTGVMRADIQVREANFDRIVINTTRVPYAIYHNEGTTRVAKREFIGPSKLLEGKILNLVKNFVKMLKR